MFVIPVSYRRLANHNPAAVSSCKSWVPCAALQERREFVGFDVTDAFCTCVSQLLRRTARSEHSVAQPFSVLCANRILNYANAEANIARTTISLCAIHTWMYSHIFRVSVHQSTIALWLYVANASPHSFAGTIVASFLRFHIRYVRTTPNTSSWGRYGF